MSQRPFRAERLRKPENLDQDELQAFLDLSGELDLEIGCGVGWHPIQYARAHPERRLIAIERTRSKVERFEARLRSHPPLTNLFPMHADAVPFLVHAFPEEREVFSRIFLLYPNPSPKNSAERWIRMPFFAYLMERLKTNGTVLIASNLPEYLKEVFENAAKVSGRDWILEASGPMALERSMRPRTHFEQKYLERGEPCGEVVLRKLSRFSVPAGSSEGKSESS